MKITLLEVYSKKPQYINKDVVGTYGMVAEIGDSFLAKIIERSKKKSISMPVLSLPYLAAIFKQNGHSVNYKFNEIPQDVDLIIIPSSIIDFKREIDFAKKIKKETKAKIGFFGPFASYFPEMYLETADFVINGEPEFAAYKIKDGVIPKGVVTSEHIEDLNSLPAPYWDIFPIKDYSYMPNLKKRPFLPVLSSQGCVYNCLYCPHKAYFGKLRVRRPDLVVQELKTFKEKYGIKSFQFRDSLFTADRARVFKIIDGMLKNNLKLEWGCETHVNYLDYELIDKMYDAGLRAMNLGIESSDAEILKNASRISANKQKEMDIIAYCHKKGINIAAFYIFGMPDDTKQTILDTIKYAKKLNTLVAQFFIFTPFPGTTYYDKLKNDIFEQDFERFTSFNPVFRHSHLSREELLKLKEKAFVSYYFRPAYFLKHFKKHFNLWIRGILN